jgi:hypothetical protein
MFKIKTVVRCTKYTSSNVCKLYVAMNLVFPISADAQDFLCAPKDKNLWEWSPEMRVANTVDYYDRSAEEESDIGTSFSLHG